MAYGGDAGQIGQQTQDLKSEVIGLGCALVLLVAMFGSVIAPLALFASSAIFGPRSRGCPWCDAAAKGVTVVPDTTYGGRDEYDRGPQQRRERDSERRERRHESSR